MDDRSVVTLDYGRILPTTSRIRSGNLQGKQREGRMRIAHCSLQGSLC